MKNIQKTIMIVDDSVLNLIIAKDLLKEKYEVITRLSGKELFEDLKEKKPDLILLDVEMPEINGYDVLRELKRNKATANIPVIFLTVRSDSGSELEGLSLGAVDYIIKPFSPALLLKRIETHLLFYEQKQELMQYNENLQAMVDRKTRTVYELQNAMLKVIAEMVEYRDNVTGGHIERTQNYIKILTQEIILRGIYKDITKVWSMDFLIQSSQLHDVGKIGIPDSILLKKGKLTKAEYEIMKTHTVCGVNILEKLEESTKEQDFLNHAKIFAGTHHEKWDGSGYPRGLKGEEIPLQGRLMAIADVYDALINKRPYKKALEHDEAVEIIIQGSGKHFDPILIEVFREISDEFYAISQKHGAEDT